MDSKTKKQTLSAKGFVSFSLNQIARLKKLGKPRTADKYTCALNSFMRFRQKREIPLKEMNTHLMMEYEVYLKSAGLCPNTTSFYLRNLRALYNRAVAQGLTVQRHPFKYVYTGIDKTPKRAVSLKEIRQIHALPLAPQSVLDWARDLFLFSFYTRGMSFVDMAFLKKKDLCGDVLSYRRRKTNQQLFIRWEMRMQAVIDKYDTGDSPYLLPIILGLTATPCRMNRHGFTDLFDTLITSQSIAEFIKKGVLSAFDYVSIRPDGVERRLIDSLKKCGTDGDYQVREMEEVLNKRTSIERLYRSMIRFAGGKKGIVYAISIDHARRIAEYYTEQGVKAVAIDGRTPREERKRLVAAFKSGEPDVLVNVEVFSEGFDCPDVEFVQLDRPTLSLAKYLQQVGRGLRRAEGKENCVVIDNVGLYRLFGLPVVPWNWEEMFRGRIAGKALLETSQAGCSFTSTVQRPEMTETDCGVETVISHDVLLARLEEWSLPCAVPERKEAVLKPWKEEKSGLWGLRCGREKVTEPQFAAVFDIRKNRAAVKFEDNRCGLLDASGKVVWQMEGCRSVKFVRHDFLMVETAGNRTCYLDLCNLRLYDRKPEVKRYGAFEMLKVGKNMYCSRTQKVYESGCYAGGLFIANRNFYLSIFEYGNRCACLLAGDSDNFYWIHRRLEDGSLVITDSEGRYYHASEGKTKVYLGSENSKRAWRDCCESIERLAERIRNVQEEQEKARKRQVLTAFKQAVPFQAGMKWGLKVGNCVTVPPIYRKIKPPVGRFCAVEMNYSQWGIVRIDGTVLVEPKYPEVTIEKDGTALLTSVTGKKWLVHLSAP